MTRAAVTAARPEHAAQLAPLIRAPDLAECLAAGYPDALSALEEALRNSTEAWAVHFDGEIAALVGVDAGYEAGAALVWALTGRAVDRAKLTFLRSSRALVAELFARHAVLFNLVDARYQGALDWLECLGFVVRAPVPHPATGMPFCPVVLGGA